jgi:hypothetical protein
MTAANESERESQPATDANFREAGYLPFTVPPISPQARADFIAHYQRAFRGLALPARIVHASDHVSGNYASARASS